MAMEEMLEGNDDDQEQQDTKEEEKKPEEKKPEDKKPEEQKENKPEIKPEYKTPGYTPGGESDGKIEKNPTKNIEKYPLEYNSIDITSFFKKIKPERHEKDFPEDILKDFNGSYYLFYCDKENKANNSRCEPGSLSCPDCMKKNQKMYKLKSHYLINDQFRICTFKKNRIYCNVKLTAQETINGICYSFPYTCGHSGQCDSCKRMTQIMDKYYGTELLEKLRKRDQKMM